MVRTTRRLGYIPYTMYINCRSASKCNLITPKCHRYNNAVFLSSRQDDERINEVVGNARQTRPGNPRPADDLVHQQKAFARTAFERANRGEYIKTVP